jgi:hypothetical protein
MHWSEMYKGRGRTQFCFIINFTSMSSVNTKITVEELCARWQAEQEAEDHWRAEEDQLFEEEIQQMAEEEERQKQKEEEDQRWEEDERKRRLEAAEKEYAWQKELEKARQGKRKAMESEDSRKKTEKELQGSNKKVSYYYSFKFSGIKRNR